MSKNRIVVVGSANTDMIVRIGRLPRPGETVVGGTFLTAPGGKGANQAVGAARAGGSVAFVARIGRDGLGAAALAGYRREGIDVRRVIRDPKHPTGVALILVGKGGENCIGVASGANEHLSAADVRRARDAIRGAGVLLLQLEIPLPAVIAAARMAARAGACVILNPAPAQDLPAELLECVSILTPNKTEAEMLAGVWVTGAASAARAAGILLARGPKSVVITLGDRGAFVATGGGCRYMPAFDVKAIDATGAGDIFNGSLAAALADGEPLFAAVRFAQAAAALSVTRPGAQSSAPARGEIERLLKAGSPRGRRIAR